ncbi:hypothetical protein HNO89_001498 [Sporosarcina luteola]|nr:hypothetical protein [Sporosarcina luteola]
MSNGIKWLIGGIIGFGILAIGGTLLVGWLFISTVKTSTTVEGSTIEDEITIDEIMIDENGESEDPNAAASQSTDSLDWFSLEPIDIKQLKKNPDKYKGEMITYEGQIVQIFEDGEYTNMRLAVNGDYNDIVFIKYFGLTDFVEDDFVTINGTVYGAYSYESQAGQKISVPGLIADKIVSF